MNIEDINKIFEKWEKLVENTKKSAIQPTIEYIPDPAPVDAPIYNPTPKDAGPQPLTIEQYKARQRHLLDVNSKAEDVTPKQKRKRAGRRVRSRQKIAELHRIANLTTDKNKKELFRSQIRLEKLKECQFRQNK